MNQKPFNILMAEDNEHDIVATHRAWKKNNIINPLTVVRDGEECLDYLYRRGAYADPLLSPCPALLLLDLKMPRLDGLGVLRQVKSDPQMRRLPVVMLTTSKAEEDLIASYSLGVNAYIMKPVGFENFSKAMLTINLFWQLVELPEAK